MPGGGVFERRNLSSGQYITESTVLLITIFTSLGLYYTVLFLFANMTRRNAFKFIPIKVIDLMFVQILIPGLKIWRLYTQELQTCYF